tara:strand:+ start:25 stop:522 length:498 start_codon:yes stop_codon:yes gene_type:complete
MSKRHLCNYDYDNELNIKINSRYFPSTSLQPNFDPRPLSTKYSLANFPLLNNYVPEDSEQLLFYNKYDSREVFYPGNSRAPVSHFLDNIDTDSMLKNQVRPLTKSDGPNYIPGSKSDLFLEKKYQDKRLPNLYVLPYQVKGTKNNKCNLAPNTFLNHTRYNVKNL